MTQFPEFKKASLYCHVHGKTNCQDCADQNLAEGIRLDQERIRDLEQRLAEAEAKNTELEKELFILASDVIYFENETLPYEIVRKAKRVYDELRRSEGEL